MSSPNISFDNIASSIRKPGKYFEFNSRLAVRTLPSNNQRLLILAQMLASGTAPAGVPVQVFDSATAAILFGRGSHAHLMVAAAIAANRYVQLRVMPLADVGGSVAAAGTVTYTGSATAAGSVTVGVAGRAVTVAIANAATPTAVAAAVKAAIDARPDWPVTATVAAGVLTLTAKNKGTIGNSVAYSVLSETPGVTAVAVQPTGGLNDPDVAAALASLFSAGDEVIAWPYNNQTALTTLRTYLRDRDAPQEMRGAVGAWAFNGSLASGSTLAGQVNGEHMTTGFCPGTTTPAFEMAAIYAAVIASEEDPAKPLNTLVLKGIQPPPLSARLSRTEQEACLNNGLTPFEVGPGEEVQIVRAITNYILDPQAVPDVAWLDLTTIRTMHYVRTSVRSRIALRFPREKKTARVMERIRSEIYDVLIKLEELEIVQNVEANKDGIIVEEDLQDNSRVNARIPVDVVNGMHVFAGRLDLIL